MISKKVLDAINEQIREEFDSGYAYLSMSAFCETANLPGFAKWLRMQAQEEAMHALKFFDFVNDRGGKVALGAIDAPPSEFKSPLDVMQQAQGNERRVTGLINRLYELAVKENDYPAQVLLQWFITEQVEEEKNAGLIVEQLRMIGGDGPALLEIDRNLGGRTTPV